MPEQRKSTLRRSVSERGLLLSERTSAITNKTASKISNNRTGAVAIIELSVRADRGFPRLGATSSKTCFQPKQPPHPAQRAPRSSESGLSGSGPCPRRKPCEHVVGGNWIVGPKCTCAPRVQEMAPSVQLV